MSSFLFLHFCDDVFELLGLYFSAFILSRVSSGGFLPLPPKPPQWSHTASTGLVCGFAGVAPYPALKTAHKAAQGRVWFLPRTNLPLPLKGEGLGIILVGFALLAHNRATLAQQGRSGASLVSFPYPASKTAQKATQGRVWLSLSFPGALLLRQASKLSFQVVVDSFLDGPDGELQGAIPHLAGLGTHLGGFHVDELLVLQLPNVLGYGVGAHARVLTDLPDAGPALVGFPVLA